MTTERQFRSMYELHQPDVLAYFLRRLKREDAVEATADVFLAAWRRASDVPDGEGARLWLFGIARNVLRNRQRADRRLRRLLARAAFASLRMELPPESVVIRREEDAALLEALGKLRFGDRELLQLRLWEEASYDEIAELLGCSHHAAELRYSRALQRLRDVCRRSGHPRELYSTPAQESPHEA